MKMNRIFLLVSSAMLLSGVSAFASATEHPVAKQRQALASNTHDQGFGPQSPRDISQLAGENKIAFNPAPPASAMNLCNIHFHRNAEHAGGEFSSPAEDDNQAGFRYSGTLTRAELAPVKQAICPSEQSSLATGDTIELHYVYSSAKVSPGPTLGACFNDAIKNPQLRAIAQVYVLVNDEKALDFNQLTAVSEQDGLYQAINIPTNTGDAIEYAGSTTGPTYNEIGSPFQVTWSVKPKVAKVNIASVGQWCESNIFEEDHAHGVRNLVINPDLLAPITQ
ncbi:delta-class carbonic anhydrase [Oceanisphaera avium]|uniref:Cadmium carbonic anhydrase n=1 Tax=Oceanisphaera avium TaxID=1903694 RepID=A0A1Y0CV22_9GAMM|nr:delta-class carbonic anhydrase [Oceanisphaera avium]ART79191.1 hypothetical protein CBP12_02705 [Oceanisphaera avium]